MNSGHDDRLDAVTHDLHAVLERKLGDLLGQVQAAQSLANAVKGAEDEIRRKAGVAEFLRNGGNDAEADSIEREIDAIFAVRDAYVEDLASLVGELHG
jgi:hypothetical protein